MKIAKTSYKIASWSLLIVGIGHTVTYLAAPITTAQNEMIIIMKDLTFQMLGTKANIFSFYEGFSLMMGILLIGYGLLNILILKHNQQSNLPSNILILNIIISLVSVIISLKYFFIVPIVFTTIPLLGFTISLSTKNKSV